MDWFNSPRLRIAANWISLGEVIAYPTEAVWGLGCDPFNPQAVAKLLALKQRPVEKGLILIAAHINQFAPLLARLDQDHYQQLKDSWPAPITSIIRPACWNRC